MVIFEFRTKTDKLNNLNSFLQERQVGLIRMIVVEQMNKEKRDFFFMMIFLVVFFFEPQVTDFDVKRPKKVNFLQLLPRSHAPKTIVGFGPSYTKKKSLLLLDVCNHDKKKKKEFAFFLFGFW